MPKNIVVCCDGTGNEFGDSNSNVVKLCSTLVVDDRHQVFYYHPGVGTMGSPSARTRLGKSWDIIRGLAFGYGVTANISDAYRYLMETYEPDDRIFLFGFSRGAYTARALGGLLHMYGLLQRGNEGLIPYITEKFASRSREAQGMSHTFQVAEEFKHTYSRDVLIHFVGVWDTVSSVGWISDPVVIPFTACNPIMVNGRHAVSIDERRCFFRDNLWGKPFQAGDPQYRVTQDIKQVWFAGVHSDVGGSYPEGESGLSKITLEWMLREAIGKGLLIKEDNAKRVLGLACPTPYVPPNATDGQHESLHGAWWAVEFLPHYKWDKRRGMQHWTWPPLGTYRHLPPAVVVHESVVARQKAVAAYRPSNLPKDFGVEKYEPLFPELPPRQADQRRFSALSPGERAQAVLDFKTDANPLLNDAPDMWPRYPLLAALLALAAICVASPQSVHSWPLIGGFEDWIAKLLLGLGTVVLLLLTFGGCRKRYRIGLVKYFRHHEDKHAVEGAPEPPPYVRPQWKMVNELVAGLIAAGVILSVRKDHPAWNGLAAAIVFAAAGLAPAFAVWGQARAFNALCRAWCMVSDQPELLEYRKRQRAKSEQPPNTQARGFHV